MVFFGLINYEDYIFRTIVTSTYARNALTVVLMYIITGIIRFHLSMLLCWLCSINNIFNLVIPIIIGVILSVLSDTLYQYVGIHRSSYERLVDYIITNYSRENMVRWKRRFLLGIFIYIIIAVSLINIDNEFLFITTLQTAFTFVICDLIEHRQSVYNKLDKLFNRPKVNKLSKEFSVINNYPIVNDNKIIKIPDRIKSTPNIQIDPFDEFNEPYPLMSGSTKRISPPVASKPTTPPTKRISQPVASKPTTPPTIRISIIDQ